VKIKLMTFRTAVLIFFLRCGIVCIIPMKNPISVPQIVPIIAKRSAVQAPRTNNSQLSVNKFHDDSKNAIALSSISLFLLFMYETIILIEKGCLPSAGKTTSLKLLMLHDYCAAG